MRIAEKEADMEKSGIEKIVSNLETYPIMLDASDDANIAYAGTSESDSWPANTVFDGSAGSNFRRLKLCSTLVETLQRYSDPRLDLWASKVAIPIMVDETLAAGTDIIESGVRYVASDIAADYENRYGFALDVDPEYVGLPPAWSIVPQAYNLNPNLEQAPQNPHASHLNDIYKKASGQHLKARLLTAAEIHFILAEAAIKGWSVGSAEDHYNNGVMASFGAWDLGSGYENYISGNGVSFDGTLAQVMEQKWIASWTAAAEAWFDYRRTGLPDLQAGINVKRTVLPIRFYYSVGEMDYNPDNITVAINNLEATDYTAPDGKNSAWSKMWVLQGIEKPW
jgi:hypothetical protein